MRNREAGFSLTELLLAMGLFSLLGVGMVALLSSASDDGDDTNRGVDVGDLDETTSYLVSPLP